MIQTSWLAANLSWRRWECEGGSCWNDSRGHPEMWWGPLGKTTLFSLSKARYLCCLGAACLSIRQWAALSPDDDILIRLICKDEFHAMSFCCDVYTEHFVDALYQHLSFVFNDNICIWERKRCHGFYGHLMGTQITRLKKDSSPQN